MKESKNAVLGFGSLIKNTSFGYRFLADLIDNGTISTEDFEEIGVPTKNLLDVEFGTEVDKQILKIAAYSILEHQTQKESGSIPDKQYQEVEPNRDVLEEVGVLGEKYTLTEEESQKDLSKPLKDVLSDENYSESQISELSIEIASQAVSNFNGESFREIIWEKVKESEVIECLPVKAPGRRGYFLESGWRGNTQLTAIPPTQDYEMNGLMYVGVSDSQRDQIISDEGDAYEVEEIEISELDFYQKMPEEVTENLPDEVTVLYANDNHEYANFETARTRHSEYHKAIVEEIETVFRDKYGDQIADNFIEDFRETTYENPISGAPPISETNPESNTYELFANLQNIVKENENAEKNFGRLVENLWD